MYVEMKKKMAWSYLCFGGIFIITCLRFTFVSQGRKPPPYHSRQIPPPKPPKTKKDDIFDLEQYKYVDDYVLNVGIRLSSV